MTAHYWHVAFVGAAWLVFGLGFAVWEHRKKVRQARERRTWALKCAARRDERVASHRLGEF